MTPRSFAMLSLRTRAAVAIVAVVAVAVPLVLATTDREGGPRSTADDRSALDTSRTGATGATAGPADGDEAPEGVGPFDPDAPLDLSGVATVSAAQQHAAEDLVRSVLAARTTLASFESAGERGYVSIGDAFTGEEHLLDWSAVLDPATLDPDHPEGLVYDVGDDGERTLAAVMFVLPPGTRVDDAPAPGGDLTRWHLHGDLCLDPGADPPAITAITDAAGDCPAGLVEQLASPTLHVWVVAHPCGPFSELEGIGTQPGAVSSSCEHHHHG